MSFILTKGSVDEKIEVSDAAMNGITNTTKYKPIYSEEYKKLQEEADERIKENFKDYKRAYQKARNYICGKRR